MIVEAGLSLTFSETQFFLSDAKAHFISTFKQCNKKTCLQPSQSMAAGFESFEQYREEECDTAPFTQVCLLSILDQSSLFTRVCHLSI